MKKVVYEIKNSQNITLLNHMLLKFGDTPSETILTPNSHTDMYWQVSESKNTCL